MSASQMVVFTHLSHDGKATIIGVEIKFHITSMCPFIPFISNQTDHHHLINLKNTHPIESHTRIGCIENVKRKFIIILNLT